MEKNRTIVLIGAVPPPYHGTNISNKRILNSRIKNIYKLYHIDTSDHRNLNNLGRLDFINLFLGLKNFFKLFYLVLRKKPDLVYLVVAQNLAYLRDGLFITIVTLFSQAKIVIHLRSSYFRKYYNKSGWFVKKFIDLTLSNVDAGIVLGNSLKPILHKWVKDIKVVPNGTDFNPDLSKRNYKNKKEFIVSFLGNLFEFKGVFDLVKAIKEVTKAKSNVKLIFGGPWPESEPEIREKILGFIKVNQLEEKIIFKGFIPDSEKEKFFLKTDIFALPSWSEGHPNVILEAMAAACPVISIKNVGAISETVINGKTGFLVNKKSPHEIAGAINYLISNPKEIEKMGKAGRARYEKEYTLKKNINNLINVFDETMHESK